VSCGGRDDRTEEGKQLCDKCNAKNTERRKLRMLRWEEMGLCKSCGKRPPKPGCKMCAECIHRQVEYNKKRREAERNEMEMVL
jgi:hypothetical protein